MELRNYMELVADEALGRMLVDREDVCKCEHCRKDALALVLNRLPAKYIVTDKGRIMTKIKETEVQFQADIIRELVKALEIIKKSPRHNLNV